MPEIGLIFPGQGSQSVGMGRELVSAYPAAQAVYAQADQILGLPISRIMLEGPESDLNRTDMAQPALLTGAMAAYAVLKEKMPQRPDALAAAGHSLGEYSALTAAGALSFEDALRLVQARGRWMNEAAQAAEGGMAALLGATPEQAEALCLQADPDQNVQVANLNCPGQVVISGSKAGLERFAALAAENKMKMIPLKVSGPFHSRFMRPVGEKLAHMLEKIDIRTPAFPVIANVTGEPVSDPAQIRERLVQQVSGSVRWEASMACLLRLGVKHMVEVGPGKVLRGLLKKIAPEIPVLGTSNPEELEAAVLHLSK